MHVATVTVQSSQVNADITDFRLYVDLSTLPASFWNTVTSGGGDIRVYESDGTTELPREVVSCDTVNEEGYMFIRVDGTLSSSTNTDIQIFADGSSTEPASNSTYGSEIVWDRGTQGLYQAAVHCQDLTTESVNGNTVSTLGTVSLSTAGRRPGHNALSVDANTSGLRVSKSAGDINGTLQVWGKVVNNGTTHTLVSIGDDTDANEHLNIRQNTANNWQFSFSDPSNTFVTGSSADTDWHMFHLVVDDSNDKRLYVDGVEDGNSSVFWNPAGVDRMGIGVSGDSTPFGNSSGDLFSEARFRIDAMSLAEVQAEYTNQSSPGTFYTVTEIASGDTYTLDAAVGAFPFTGQVVGLAYNRILNADTGAFPYAGIDAVLTYSPVTGYTLVADTGAFAFSGVAADLFHNRVFQVDSGSFAFTGQDSTLTYTPVGGYSILAERGSFAFAGQDVDLLANRSLSADTGTFAFTGQDATFTYGVVTSLEADAGAFAFTGQDLQFGRGYVLAAETGSFAFVGMNVTFDYSAQLQPEGITLVKLKRSHTAGVVPSTSDLSEGEMGINTADGKIYMRDDSNNIVLLGGLQSGGSLPTTDPAVAGDLWNDNGTVRISDG